MIHTEQILVGQRLLDHIERGSTQCADEHYDQPTHDYISRDRAAAEKQRLFRESPLCLGLSGELPEPNTYFTHNYTGVPILVTRNAEGQVAAFLNVCRHRGAPVASGCGTARSFACPYHAWRYGLDGRLVGRPEDASFANAPRENHGLRALPTVEHDGMIWVCPTPGATFDINVHLGALAEELKAFNFGGYHFFAQRELSRKMNWKLVIDTFLESYHFPVLHRQSIAPIFHSNLGVVDSYEHHLRVIYARRTIESLREIKREEWQVLPQIVGIYVLFPNTVFVWQGEHIEWWQIFPANDDPNASVMTVSLYVPEVPKTESATRHWNNNLDLVVGVVEDEDFPVGEGIQLGFHSGAQSHIHFGVNEPALAYFHRALDSALAD